MPTILPTCNALIAKPGPEAEGPRENNHRQYSNYDKTMALINH